MVGHIGTVFGPSPRLLARKDATTLKLLIAEDAADVAQVVAFGARMTWPGCSVTIAASGAEALACFGADLPDLVVMDMGLPPPDGLAVAQEIRRVSAVPILMLTVRDGTLDKVRALDLGVDDYLTKPFDPVELFARLRALLRRAQGAAGPPPAAVAQGGLLLDSARREVQVEGRVVRLTSTEYRLLAELVRHAGTVLPQQYLLERVWGSGYGGDADSLRVFVRRLRRKLGDDGEHPRYIHTEWGIGYRFAGHLESGAPNFLQEEA